LGYATTGSLGDDELPSAAGDVQVCHAVAALDVGASHTIAALAHADAALTKIIVNASMGSCSRSR
jgi:hypothetical protein